MKAVGWLEAGEIRWLGNRKPADNTTLYVEVPAEYEEPQEVIGYTLEPIHAPRRGFITTQSFILCASCGSPVSSTGGPRYNAVCLKCVEHLDLVNKLKT